MDGLVGRQGLESVVPIGEALDALGIQLVQHHAANWPLCDLVEFIIVVKDVRQVEQLEFLDTQGAELGQRRCQHLHGANLQRFHLFLVLVERAVGIDLDLDLALGQLFSFLLEVFRRMAFGCVIGHHVAELDDDRLLGQSQQRERSESQAQCNSAKFHGV